MYTKHLKLILIVLLLLCLLDMPYGYFQFVRWFSMVAFSYLALVAIREDKQNEIFIYIALVILFQPIIKIALGRIIWNIVDVLVAFGLIYLLKKQTNK
ncbi:MAG: DUF6804 family protein [Flavobacterium sp.]